MKNNYPFRHKWLTYALCALTLIIVCAGAVVNVLRLCEIGALASSNRVMDILATVILIVVGLLVTAILFLSGYRLGKKYLVCFAGLFLLRVVYDDVLVIRQASDRSVLLLYVKTDKHPDVVDPNSGLQASIVQICIKPKYQEEFVAAIKERNRKAVYEIVPVARKEEKNA